MRSRLLILVLLTGLIAMACREAGPVRKQGTPSPAESPSPSPPPEPIRCPLTGVEAPPGLDINRPAVGVKIDNHARSRPQTGLETADVVYEELVEGGITRFLAMFHCGDAANLGPTRSARAVDPDILVQYAPVLFAYSGASPNVLRKVASTAGVVDLQHGANGAAYSRVRGRPAPHNLYTSTDRIRALPRAQGIMGPPKSGFLFDQALVTAEPAPPPAGAPPAGPPAPTVPVANKVSFSYSGAGGSNVVSYTYDPAGRKYLRSYGGQPHIAASGAQLSAVNVLVLKVNVSRAGSSPEITVTGTGEATVLRGGQVIQGRWIRPGLGDQIALADGSDQPIKLVPGNTWINLLPADRPVTLE